MVFRDRLVATSTPALRPVPRDHAVRSAGRFGAGAEGMSLLDAQGVNAATAA